LENRALFVDFMYAVAVGAALPRLDERVLCVQSPLLWGLLFMIAVFLEDFYLYHVKVLPHLRGEFPHWRGFILAMLIILTWYLSQASFPSRPRIFLGTFAFFFFLKLLGGLLMKPTQYPSRRDTLFLFPIVVAVVLIILYQYGCFSSHVGHLLVVLVPAWFVAVILWWLMDAGNVKAAD
jgi:hypothetical protein